jgi:hypothetical protein
MRRLIEYLRNHTVDLMPKKLCDGNGIAKAV